MPSSNPGYFQFPLCLLAFGEDYKAQLQHIVSYCLGEHAQRLSRRLNRPAEFPEQSALCEAARFLHVNIGSYEATTERWRATSRFVKEWEARHGKDAFVRIASSLLWEANNNSGFTYREFSILCAINSVIGNRRDRPRRITEPSIRVRAAGFKSWTVVNREVPTKLARIGRLLTPHQVRYTLESLHERKFFARARVGAKSVKYMVGITDADLRAILLQTETYRCRFKAERVQKDRELMLAIRLGKQARVGIPPPGSESTPTSAKMERQES